MTLQIAIPAALGLRHLFADPDGPDYDADAEALMLERELDFLSRLA